MIVAEQLSKAAVDFLLKARTLVNAAKELDMEPLRIFNVVAMADS